MNDRRIGKILISPELLIQNKYAVDQMLAKLEFEEISKEKDNDTGVFCYCGTSPQFDEIDEGEQARLYTINCTEEDGELVSVEAEAVNRIYSSRRILEGQPDEQKLDLDAQKLNLLATIARGNYVASSSADVNAAINKFLEFGLIVNRKVGGGKVLTQATHHGVFALNQAKKNGWKEGE